MSLSGLPLTLLCLSTLSFYTTSVSAAQDDTAFKHFEQFKSLLGHWRGAYKNGRSHDVTYRLSANDTALIETWKMSVDREALTIYTIDGDRVLATHYCPQGNQVRLVLATVENEQSYRFTFLDGANLQDQDRYHQHAFRITFGNSNSFTRSETYIPNATSAKARVSEGETVKYQRLSD